MVQPEIRDITQAVSNNRTGGMAQWLERPPRSGRKVPGSSPGSSRVPLEVPVIRTRFLSIPCMFSISQVVCSFY